MNLQNYNLLQNPNFKLSTRKLPGVEFFCTVVNWPSISVGTVEMPTPRGSHYEPGVGLQYTPLTVDFLVDEDMNNYFSIYSWMRECSVPASHENPRPYPYPNGAFFPFHDVTLTLLDNNLNALYSTVFVNAFPTDVSGITFASDIDQPIPARCSVTFRFDHFQKEGDPVYT